VPNESGEASSVPVSLEATAKRYAPQPEDYREFAGVRFFWAILGLAAITVVGLLLYVILRTPSIPALTADATPDSAYLAAVIRERANVVDNAVKLGQLLLVGICLPLLTAILGYLFGTSRRQLN
jgi:hypothetical protein